ncbi:MAG: hypothetical protein AAGF11_31060 [Myxococcota bacterium]
MAVLTWLAMACDPGGDSPPDGATSITTSPPTAGTAGSDGDPGSDGGNDDSDPADTSAGPGPDSGADDDSSGPDTQGDTEGDTQGDTEGDTGPDPATVLFEEDFEGAADDTVPTGWDSFVGYVVNMNNEPGGMAYALADSSRPHQGTKSLHVLGGQSPAMLTRPFPPGVDRVYVRVYVWLTGKLGQNPGNNHETLIGVRASVGQANDEVRFGEIKGVIGTNEVPSDDISPTMDQWGQGPVIEAGVWNCVEVAFLADQPNHEVVAWNNGQEVHRVNDPSQWNNGGGLGAQFLDGKFNEFIVGWHSFSSFSNEIWFDDLVVATERVGCN